MLGFLMHLDYFGYTSLQEHLVQGPSFFLFQYLLDLDRARSALPALPKTPAL